MYWKSIHLYDIEILFYIHFLKIYYMLRHKWVLLAFLRKNKWFFTNWFGICSCWKGWGYCREIVSFEIEVACCCFTAEIFLWVEKKLFHINCVAWVRQYKMSEYGDSFTKLKFMRIYKIHTFLIVVSIILND